MKIKYNKMVQIKNSCMKLKDKKLSIKTAYKLAKILKTVEEEDAFFREEYKKILDAYAEKDENNNYVYTDENKTNIKIQSALVEEAQNKLFDLENLDIDFPDYSFTFEDFEKIDLSMDDLMGLVDFIKEDT